jgi:hypothetical protein
MNPNPAKRPTLRRQLIHGAVALSLILAALSASFLITSFKKPVTWGEYSGQTPWHTLAIANGRFVLLWSASPEPPKVPSTAKGCEYDQLCNILASGPSANPDTRPSFGPMELGAESTLNGPGCEFEKVRNNTRDLDIRQTLYLAFPMESEASRNQIASEELAFEARAFGLVYNCISPKLMQGRTDRQWYFSASFSPQTEIILQFPLWGIVALSLLLPTYASARVLKRRKWLRTGRCASCGYYLTGNTSGICPECGTPCLTPADGG